VDPRCLRGFAHPSGGKWQPRFFPSHRTRVGRSAGIGAGAGPDHRLAGIGHAYDLGIRQALADITDTTEHWLVLTAADLPFGFSDLSHAVPFLGPGQTASLLMGSKAIPEQVHVSPERALASQVYRALRRIVAGMRSAIPRGASSSAWTWPVCWSS